MGGGSIERLGFLAPFRAALEKVGVETVLFSGIEPNPQARTINKAAALASAARKSRVCHRIWRWFGLRCFQSGCNFSS